MKNYKPIVYSRLSSESESSTLFGSHKKKHEGSEESLEKRISSESYITRSITKEDTLHSLSLTYNVPIAELKRANNIISDSEFFALKKIKIPAKPLSVLHDIIISTEPCSSFSQGWKVEKSLSPIPPSSCLSEGSDEEFSSDSSNHWSPDKKTRKVKKILRSMDKDLERIKDKHKESQINQPFSSPTPLNEFLPSREPQVQKNLSLCCILLLGTAICGILVIARLTFIPLPTDSNESHSH